MRRSRIAATLGLVLSSSYALTCVRTRELPPCDASPELPSPPKRADVAVVAAVGDIAECSSGRQAETAALVRRIDPDAVLTLGDNVYPNASLDEFLDCYHETWGEFRPITRAVVGNHEYHAPHAGPFFAYFCGGVGAPFEGRASFSLGAWHVVLLNSNCGEDLDVPTSVAEEFGGCGADSAQARWLAADLAAHPSHCTLAVWHHPLFSSGPLPPAHWMRDTWRVLHAAGVEAVLSGHAHLYERFEPLDADGHPDPARGLRQFIVGTGGKTPLHRFRDPAPGSVARNDEAFGVLRLELGAEHFAWRFVSVDGSSFADEGEAPCHE